MTMICDPVQGLLVASGPAWLLSAVPTLSPSGPATARASDNWLLIAAICLVPPLALGLLFALWGLWKRSAPLPSSTSAATPPSPCLESATCAGGPRQFLLEPGGVTIGQAPENDIVIAQEFPGWQTVSRRHACIYQQTGRWIIEDLGSMNGTYVNGRRTSRNLLRDCWRVGVGEVEFVFHAGPGEVCPRCGHENRGGAQFCRRCGKALPDSTPWSTQPLPRLSDHQTPSTTTPPRPFHGSAPQGNTGGHEEESTTRPLPGASVAFAPLPKGALLRDGEYTILEVYTVDEQSNVYLAESKTSVWSCPNCRTAAVDPRGGFCTTCGADLSSAKPLRPRYMMHESAAENAFAGEAQLLGMHLEHPGLRLPCAVFAEAPYGPARHYLVEPEPSLPRAASLTVPQPVDHVLVWGVSLAQALDYLHRHHVTPRTVGLDHIAIAGREACWIDLSANYIVSKEPRCLAQAVQGLAEVLLYLATGQQQATHSDLPKQLAIPLSQTFATPTQITAATFATALESALQELRRPASVTLVVGHRTDVGQERVLNEDSLLALDVAPVFRSVSAPVGLFVVADGMGGHEAGDIASQLTVQAIARQAVDEVLSLATAEEPLPDARQWLTATAMTANQAVYERRRAMGTDMGTTLVMALVVGDTATIVNVGDSRAYQLKKSGIVRITTDHSLVEHLVATGHITPGEAINHPQRNIIYRVIGDQAQVEADVFEQQLDYGEALLLCSDGLSGMVSEEQIWRIWREANSPQEACDQLVEAANQAGGEDNVTVVIVQVAT
jgi:serine/threonine protein phosphatase PrpC